ncbi:MAG: hypothetical protein ACYSTS_18520 [Planctomycetota bacterium]|jgi:hypothetical protein
MIILKLKTNWSVGKVSLCSVKLDSKLYPGKYFQVVSTITGYQTSLMKDGEPGLLVRPGDANDLADKIKLLVNKHRFFTPLNLVRKKQI